ncbi:MAG: acylneuraminate cytidylyltransferase family protein [Pseudomonadota bacterium]|nr:acylneuraminate cytidylyltransferase family protein [Pseudomonadota bacterium]
MKRYAFIFARKGSKGLPEKNKRPFHGKPLVLHSIEQAKELKEIDRVFVSTDDKEIKQICLLNKVEVIDRPAELAQDTSPEWKAWIHAIEFVYNKYGEFEEFISLPVTSPLREKKDILKAIERKKNVKADVCITVTDSLRNPHFNMVLDKDEFCQIIFSGSNLDNRQQAPKVYDICTLVYVCDPEYIVKNNHLFDGNVTYIKIPKERSIDIDDEIDFQIAEFLFEKRAIK